MKLIEGTDNWNHFDQNAVTGFSVTYDGKEELVITFMNDNAGDQCEVTFDWIEEIKGLRSAVETMGGLPPVDCKVYPDDWRNVLIRACKRDKEVEWDFLKSYQTVRVIMYPEKADVFLNALRRILDEPGKLEFAFNS